MTEADNLQSPDAKDLWMGMARFVGSELRSPMTLIYGYAELLRDGELGPLTKEQRRGLGTLFFSAKRVTELLTAGTEFALIQSGNMYSLDSEVLSLSACADDAMQDLLTSIERKGQTLTVQLPDLPLVRFSMRRLERTLTQLLGNAHRYTPEKGHITLSAEQHSDFVRVLVTDTGAGIAPEDVPRIFEPWFVSRNPASQGYGLGLGLYLAKYHVEQVGGEIGFESELGKGSTFWFTVPVAR